MKKKITSFFIAMKTVACNIFIVFVLLALPFFGLNANSNAGHNEEFYDHTNEILVKYKNNDNIQVLPLVGELDEELIKYNRKEDIEYAEPNYIYKAAIIPSDTYFNNQWYLNKIEAPRAWDISRMGEEIVIAIIDSGVQIEHPDLKDNIWKNSKEIEGNGIDDDKNGFIDDSHGWDFVNNVADPRPKFNEGYTRDGIIHGTVVAGIAAAYGNNGTGVAGVVWQSKLMPLKVLDDKGEGDTQKVVQAIDYAINNGADILNFSFVGFGFSQALENAIRRAYNAGLLIVAAAGNDEDDGNGINIDVTPLYPACHDGAKNENMVIGVGATDTLDQKAVFSSFGHDCIDIMAPGVSIFSTSVFEPGNKVGDSLLNKYYDGYWSGTSMAAPMVSGAIALIQSINPSLSPDQVKNVLFDSAENINRLNPTFLNQLGRGRLNVYRAVKEAQTILGQLEAKILIAPVSIDQPMVSVYDLKGNKENDFFAYNENFRGGVNMAAGDINGDGVDEIVTGAGFGGGPHIRIFDHKGNLVGQFFAYDKNFRGGVNVSAGDINGDGVDEIVTGAGLGGGPQVRIFKLNGNILGQFFAYDKNFRGGVRVATAKLHQGARGAKLDIVTAPGSGGGPHIRVFDSHAQILGQFFAYSENFRGGVSLAAADIDNDGLYEIVTGAGPGGAPHVRTFESNGRLISSFFAGDASFAGGVNVSTLFINK